MPNDPRSTALAERIDPAVTGGLQIAQKGPGVPQFATMRDMTEFAKVMATAGSAIRPAFRNNPGACFKVLAQAQRWSMDAFSVADKAFEVNGNMAYEAQLIVAVINTRAPIQGRLKTRFIGEGNDRQCIAYAKFIGDDEFTEVESPKFSQIQPKNSPLWKSDPDQQLAYYCKRAWARRECPEIMLGVYDIEEAQSGMVDITPAAGPKLGSKLDRFEAEARPVIVEHENEQPVPPIAPAPDPFDPETGELDPPSATDRSYTVAAIPVPEIDGKPDWKAWKSTVLESIESAGTQAEVSDIEMMNGPSLARLKEIAPRSAGAIQAEFDRAMGRG